MFGEGSTRKTFPLLHCIEFRILGSEIQQLQVRVWGRERETDIHRKGRSDFEIFSNWTYWIDPVLPKSIMSI